MWSLSIEEQFYLFLPFVLVFLYRNTLLLLFTLILVSLLSLGAYLFYINDHPTATFYLLPTRFWEFSVGSIISIIHTYKNTRIRNKLVINIIHSIAIILIFISQETSFTLISPIFNAVIGCLMLIYFNHENTFVYKFLSNNFFKHIGKLSYSIYLWHWPLLYAFQFFEISNFYTLKYIVSLYILSSFSYFFIENNLRYNLNYFKIIFCCLLSVIIFSLYVSFKEHTFKIPNIKKPIWDVIDCSPNWKPSKSNIFFDTLIINNQYSPNSYKEEGIIINNQKCQFRLLILGDSHGVMWSNALKRISYDLNVTSHFFTMSGGQSPFFKYLLSKTKILSIFLKLNN